MTSESLVGSISPESWPGKRLSFFVAGGDERLGVFSCEVRDPSTNIVTSIDAIKISKFTLNKKCRRQLFFMKYIYFCFAFDNEVMTWVTPGKFIILSQLT